MQQKQRPVFKTSASRSTARPRPIQTASPEAKNFPGVGVTLKSYNRTSPAPEAPTSAVATTHSRWQRILRRITLKRVVLLVAVLVLIVGGLLGGKFAYNAHKLFGGSIFNVLNATKLKGEDTSRVNILLAGNSADDAGHEGGLLTDSIMILSIDTKNHSAFMLSVPRDLWVNVPGNGYSKINYAYVAGQNDKFAQNGYPSGGMGLLEQIVEQDFGLPINYYALVNYNAFKQAVDAVGGIDFNVQSTDPRGLYDPNIDYTTHGPLVKLTNGVHHLNGQQSLDMARARGDSYRSYGFPQSDFDRTTHQRQMLVALKSKAVSAGVISNPAKLSKLSDAVANNAKTDFSLSEVHRLFDLMKGINDSGIVSMSLNNANGKNLLVNYATPGGQSALSPAAGVSDFSDIQAYIKQQSSADPVVREGAKLVLLNATGTKGLASKQRTTLLAKNYIVSSVGDANVEQALTTIIDASSGSKPATLAQLRKKYPKATVTTVNPYASTYATDFVIVIGSDQIPASNSANTTNKP